MKRRTFLRNAGLGLASATIASKTLRADDEFAVLDTLRGLRVTSITGFRHDCPRPKLVGKNSHLDVHGDRTVEQCLRIGTDRGIEGIGVGNLPPDRAEAIVGRTLDEFWRPGVGSVGAFGRADHALFDLVGKALGVPSWTLFGGRGPERVPVYDGSIYFADLLPEYQGRGVDRIIEEIEAGLDRGHRAFKIKVGRGYKWMEPAPGFRRDVEVVRAIREHVGPDVRLMVDANNGFDLDTTIRFLDAIETELVFIEEPFPEVVEEDLALKAALRDRGLDTLAADGESAGDPSHFEPFLDAEALDVVQPDIRAFGLTLQWEQSRRLEAAGAGARLAPHNWGSHLGIFMQAILARGIPNFLMAEVDTSTSDLFDSSAFKIEDGRMTVPDTPGCGLALRDDVFEARYRADAWTVEAE